MPQLVTHVTIGFFRWPKFMLMFGLQGPQRRATWHRPEMGKAICRRKTASAGRVRILAAESAPWLSGEAHWFFVFSMELMTGHDYHSKASAGSVNSRKLTAGTWKRPLGKGNTSIYKPPIFNFHVSIWGLVKTPRVILWSACFEVHFFDLQISKSVAKSALDRSFGASEFLKLTVTYWKRKSGLQWMHTTVPRSTFQGAKGLMKYGEIWSLPKSLTFPCITWRGPSCPYRLEHVNCSLCTLTLSFQLKPCWRDFAAGKKNHVAIVRFVSFVLLDLNMFGIIFWTLIQSNSKKPGLNYWNYLLAGGFNWHFFSQLPEKREKRDL